MQSISPETELHDSIQSVFKQQRRFAPQMALTTSRQRIERLKRLRDWVMAHEAELFRAMAADFRKPVSEVLIGDLGALYYEIKHTCAHLEQWMRPQRIATPLAFIGHRSYYQYEPKGNVLIISPWNYPFGLAIKPLVTAIAAGNVAIIKPSEMTPNTSAFLVRMIGELFPPEEVSVFEGDASVAQALLELPFNHIFFTGSPAVGKIVMAAAARHLTSVTLELGGKSPVIVDETANISEAAKQIAWAKYFNNGQTCISPDYLLIHQAVKQPFMEAFRAAVQNMYGKTSQEIEASDSYCRIVNKKHFNRVKNLIDDAVQQGASVALGGKRDETSCFIEPTVLDHVSPNMQVMQEEIFGPVLPVIPYADIDEALRLINSREKPLALYIQSKSRRTMQYIMARTTAGDTVINDLLWQFGHPELPFGGVNNSGIGKANGLFGFQEFSNIRGVMRREFGTAVFIYPPYTDTVKKLIAFLVKKL